MESVSLRELTFDEIDLVGGGGDDMAWGISTGVGAALAVGAATVIAMPFLAFALAGGSMVASGFAIYYGFAK
ncbi:MAG: hypothetical protein O3A63_21365 [Proteobacteria bacterium]|nr:hypothetical protein [Pseudomonadota bacterium]